MKEKEGKKNKQENIYQRGAKLANKKKIISIASIIAIFAIAILIYVVAVVIDIKENESQKQALVQNEQVENRNDSNNQEQKTKAFEIGGNVAAIIEENIRGKVYKAPIPKGYIASPVEGEKLISTGLVIYEDDGTGSFDGSNATAVDNAQETRNQYVWVPVSDASEMYETDENGKKWGKLYDFGTSTSPKKPPEVRSRSSNSYREPDILTKYDKDSKLKTYGLGIKTAYEFQIQLEKEFNQMIESVEKYGGFFIGRYETGDLSKDVPVVRKGNGDIWDQTWYAMYQKSGKLAGANSSVQTSMIWGCQWDATLKWLVESGSKTYEELTNSISWGNYENSTGEAEENSGRKQTTGYSKYWKANNIYDMAGNVNEWTIEASDVDSRVARRRRVLFFGDA